MVNFSVITVVNFWVDEHIILCCAEGLAIKEVGERCGLSQLSVFKWKKRFLEGRIEGLTDEPCPARPAHVSAARWLAVVKLATSAERHTS